MSRLPSSAQFPELTAFCPAPWHFLKKKKDIYKKSSNRELRKYYRISASTKQLKPDVKKKKAINKMKVYLTSESKTQSTVKVLIFD